ADVQHGCVVAVDQGPGVLDVDGADVLQDLVVNGAKAGHGDSSSGGVGRERVAECCAPEHSAIMTVIGERLRLTGARTAGMEWPLCPHMEAASWLPRRKLLTFGKMDSAGSSEPCPSVTETSHHGS